MELVFFVAILIVVAAALRARRSQPLALREASLSSQLIGLAVAILLAFAVGVLLVWLIRVTVIETIRWGGPG
jgi:hypothetical protein